MNGIDPASQLAALIRVQVASLRKRPGGGRTAPEPPQREATAGGAGDIAALAAQRIRALSRDDPERERKAFRLFLETVLMSELGAGLVNDPAFATMVDHVQQQMESDATLARACGEAARVLLKSADG